jgi:hypothetical protein
LTFLCLLYYGPRVNLPRASAALLLAAALLTPTAASADESAQAPSRDDDAGLAALLAGAVTALIPVAIGATIADRGKDDAAKDVGLRVAGAGLALSPFTAHAVAGEWKRALAFSAVPVASEIAISVLLSARPDAVYHGDKITRTTFALLFSVDVFIAALGVVDASLAGDRAKERAAARPAKSAAPALRYLAPTVAGGTFGLTIGGTL